MEVKELIEELCTMLDYGYFNVTPLEGYYVAYLNDDNKTWHHNKSLFIGMEVAQYGHRSNPTKGLTSIFLDMDQYGVLEKPQTNSNFIGIYRFGEDVSEQRIKEMVALKNSGLRKT